MTPGPRALIVDDDDDQRFLVRRLLARSGISEIEEAGDGQQALEQARAFQPALIVLDLSMPVLSGIDVLPALHDAAPGARVVVVSGFPRRRMADIVIERGAVGYVEKGADASTLVQEILLAAALAASLVERLGTTLEATVAAPGQARRFIREALDPGGEEVVDTVELLVSELVTNAVVHAASEPRLEVEVSPSLVRVAVYDDDPDLPAHRDPDVERPGGRGLHLLDQLASRWSAERAGTGKVVWFELDR
jgi:DNA-binding NarL/FixJ family response regulator